MPAPRDDPGDNPATVPELTAAIARGDEEAFTRFHQLYWKRIYTYNIVLTRGDQTLAADLAQTVMIRAATRLPVLESEQALWSWLTRVARNAFIDACRVGKRRPPMVEWTEASTDSSAVYPLPASPLLTALDEALLALSPGERNLVEETYFNSRKQADLAGELGLSIKALESRLTRLRRKLRGMIFSSLRKE